jgi:S-adenosylmethionine hydrolase
MISEFRQFYGDGDDQSLFAIWGSAGFLEISVNGGSAAKVLSAKRGDEVSLT